MAGETEVHDEAYDKTLGQFRLKLNALMFPLRRYGQEIYVDQAIEELVSLGVQLHLKLCGVDIPYEVEDIHW